MVNSRPVPPWDMGVRPNSPAQTIRVSSSIPRCLRSPGSGLAPGPVDLLGLQGDTAFLTPAVVVPVFVVEAE